MSKVLQELRSLINPTRSYSSGKVISVSGDKAVVSTLNGRVECSIRVISSLGEGDSVHIEDKVIIGKLRPESTLRRYYV